MRGRDGLGRTHSLIEIDANLLQNLLDNLVAFFFDANVHGVIYSAVDHLLPLLHNVVLALKLHRDPL